MNSISIYNEITHVRIIATLVIVAYHCVCPYYSWGWEGYLHDSRKIIQIVDFIFSKMLYNTMLPTFFLISGMLFYLRKSHYSHRKSTFWKKFNRLIVPNCLIFALCTLLNLPNIGGAIADGHLWFVQVLFIFFCFVLLLYGMKEKWIVGISVFMYILYIVNFKFSLGLSMMEQQIFRYFIYFAGGYYIVKYHAFLRDKIGCVILLYFITFMLQIKSIYGFLFNVVLFCVVSDKPVLNKFLISINENSFGIYLLHHVVIFYMFRFTYMQQLYAESAIEAFLCMFTISLSLSWIGSIILKKVGFDYF